MFGKFSWTTKLDRFVKNCYSVFEKNLNII